MSQADPASPRPVPGEHPTTGQVVRRLGPVGPLAVASAVFPAINGIILLVNARTVGSWLRTGEAQAFAAYIVLFAVMAGLALLPTYVSAIIGGWAFGFGMGFPAALAGFLGGAAIGYEVGRRASGDRVERLIAEQPKWRIAVDSLVHRGFWRTLCTVALLRLPPNSPFAITNLVMASTKVPRVPFLLGTALGMAPRTALAVFVGAGLAELARDDIADARRKYLFWGIGVAVAVVLIIGQMVKNALERSGAAAGLPESRG